MPKCRRTKPKRRLFLAGLAVALAVVSIALLLALEYFRILPHKYYTAADFGIETVKSTVDFNENGVDDYTDILLGARKDAENKPRYDGAYVAGGYPPDDVGVCTDVVWRAFKNAGYCLKDMVDNDIKADIDSYPRVLAQGKRDSNIDFRRVPNLKVFFSKYAQSLTLDPTDIASWQPGDIVIYEQQHVAIVSDRRNAKGVPYIIHNGGQPVREEDALVLPNLEISGHYRFDASKVDSAMLIPFPE